MKTEEEFLKYLETKIDSICMSVRHDFGLLDKDKQDDLRFEAELFIRAISKELGI